MKIEDIDSAIDHVNDLFASFRKDLNIILKALHDLREKELDKQLARKERCISLKAEKRALRSQ